MITVTPNACAALAELLDDAGVPPHLVLRVVESENGALDVALEAPQFEDTVFNFRGRNVLAVPPQAAERLDETTLDV